HPRLIFTIVRGCRQQDADAPHALALLRARHERPRCSRAAEQRDEVPPPHVGFLPPHNGYRAADHSTTRRIALADALPHLEAASDSDTRLRWCVPRSNRVHAVAAQKRQSRNSSRKRPSPRTRRSVACSFPAARAPPAATPPRRQAA